MLYIIGIGSNWHRAHQMSLARARLTSLFPGIRFSEEVETEPLFFSRSDRFSNQVAQFTSSLSALEVKALLKAVEREAGRLPEDKFHEIVRLDLDLLQADTVVFKPEDLERPYVKAGIASLSRRSF